MRPISSSERRTPRSPIPPLVPGERLSQPEFHRRYEQYPGNVKFELIGGIVYMASPLRRGHGTSHFKLGTVLGVYMGATPSVEGLDNTTTILGEDSEPQPDLALRILPEFGGQSGTNEQDYVVGAPELVAEVAHSTEKLDLTVKLKDYRKAGVVEYLVAGIKDQQIHWFDIRTGKEIKADRQHTYRSRIFPGLWIDGRALVDRDTPRLLEVIQRGSAASNMRRLSADSLASARGRINQVGAGPWRCCRRYSDCSDSR